MNKELIEKMAKIEIQTIKNGVHYNGNNRIPVGKSYDSKTTKVLKKLQFNNKKQYIMLKKLLIITGKPLKNHKTI